MTTVDLVMPKMGESIMEATILKWHKKAGDSIKMDETLLEIATDKVDSEIPSTAAGVVKELLFDVNDVVPIGTVIARIRTDVKDSSQSTVQSQESQGGQESQSSQTDAENRQQKEQIEIDEIPNPKPQTSNTNRFYSPLVLNIAAQEGVGMSELENIPGTGGEGRVSKKDILQFVSDKRAGRVQGSKSKVQSQEIQSHQQEMVIPIV